jgi:hypothetical protein
MNDAGPALCGVATDMGSGHAEVLAKVLHQQGARLDLAPNFLSVHGHGYSWHRYSPKFLCACLLSCAAGHTLASTFFASTALTSRLMLPAGDGNSIVFGRPHAEQNFYVQHISGLARPATVC